MVLTGIRIARLVESWFITPSRLRSLSRWCLDLETRGGLMRGRSLMTGRYGLMIPEDGLAAVGGWFAGSGLEAQQREICPASRAHL